MTGLFAPSAPRVLALTVPMPPNIANGRMHHMVKHQVKCAYWASLDVALLARHTADLPLVEKLVQREIRRAVRTRKPMTSLGRELQVVQRFAVAPPAEDMLHPTKISRASIRSTMYLGAAMDEGNALNRHKWVEDWLVTRGFLLDDRKKCLRWEGLPTQIVKRDGNYRIELTLTEEVR